MVRPVLMDLQRGQCFYCGETASREGDHVDHFIPWAKYPINLGHNFVLADQRCGLKNCAAQADQRFTFSFGKPLIRFHPSPAWTCSTLISSKYVSSTAARSWANGGEQ